MQTFDPDKLKENAVTWCVWTEGSGMPIRQRR